MIKKAWLRQLFAFWENKPRKNLQRLAAESGADAQNNLGALLAHSDDSVAAADSYRKAADQGNAMAQNNLAMMYALGEGVPRDDKEANKWFLRAAEQGDAGAQFHLGGRFHRSSLGLPVSESVEARIEAFKWFQLATAQGYPNAEASCELVNLRMSRADVDEGNRRVYSFVATPERGESNVGDYL